MIVGFTGDVVFTGLKKFTETPCLRINGYLHKISLVINLESVFIPSTSEKPMKDKVCLCQGEESIGYISKLNPFLINLANNHINDYGNLGVKYTKQMLDKLNFSSFGVGSPGIEHNIFVDEEARVVYISYVSRESDLSGSPLFNTKGLKGPKELSIKRFQEQTRYFRNNNYVIVVLLHWGLEHRQFPLPQQREMARELVNNGASLIIGNHAHVVQRYEKYRGKWIFYALGNFLFPDATIMLRNKEYIIKQSSVNKKSILPVFSFKNGKAKFLKLLYLQANENYELDICNITDVKKGNLWIKYGTVYNCFYFLYDVLLWLKKKGFRLTIRIGKILRALLHGK